MSIEVLRSFFGWCAVINLIILVWWFLVMVFARNWVYKIHTKWFPMPEEKFNMIHYSGMMFFKLSVFVYFVVPYIVLRIIG